MSAIDKFEKDMVLSNDKILVSKKKSLPWLEDGVDDEEYNNGQLDVYDFSLNTMDTHNEELFPSHWETQDTIKPKKVTKRKKIISYSDSEQSSFQDNSESKNNENKCNGRKQC